MNYLLIINDTDFQIICFVKDKFTKDETEFYKLLNYNSIYRSKYYPLAGSKKSGGGLLIFYKNYFVF